MSFVHMKNPNIGVAERPQHGHAANPRNRFLAQPIALIAAKEKIRKSSIR